MSDEADVRVRHNAQTAGMRKTWYSSWHCRELVVIAGRQLVCLSGSEFSYLKVGDGNGWGETNHFAPFPLLCSIKQLQVHS